MKSYMEQNRQDKLFLDTSYLVSFLYDEDDQNEKALRFSDEIKSFKDLFITEFIYAELSTVLSQKRGKKLDLDKEIQSLGIEILFTPKSIFERAITNYPKLTKKDISFIDLLTSIYAGENTIITFDKHFKFLSQKYGFNIIGI